MDTHSPAQTPGPSPLRLRPPSMQALACFEAAERLGTISRAADALHLTQGAVSRQLLALEERLGVRLFLRGRQALALTPAGRTFLAEVRPLLRRLDRAVADLRAHRGRGGRLRLSVASTFATHWLIPRLPGFTAANPDITLDLATRIGPVDFDRVDVDAAITYIDAPVPPVLGVRLLPLRLCACAAPALARELMGNPPGRPLPWLETAPLLVNVSVPDAWPAWAAAAGVAPERAARLHEQPGARYDLLSMALNAALAGIGVALLPDFLAAPALAARRLKRLSPRVWETPRAYHLSHPPHSAELPALQRFQAWVTQEAGAPPAA
jgi:LysR family transcriptional regulator, glycine cleavage system transcriptional activator